MLSLTRSVLYAVGATLLLLAGCQASAPVAPTYDRPHYPIRGQVDEARTGQALDSATVVLRTRPDTFLTYQGAFSAGPQPIGLHLFEISKRGYFTRRNTSVLSLPDGRADTLSTVLRRKQLAVMCASVDSTVAEERGLRFVILDAFVRQDTLSVDIGMTSERLQPWFVPDNYGYYGHYRVIAVTPQGDTLQFTHANAPAGNPGYPNRIYREENILPIISTRFRRLEPIVGTITPVPPKGTPIRVEVAYHTPIGDTLKTSPVSDFPAVPGLDSLYTTTYDTMTVRGDLLVPDSLLLERDTLSIWPGDLKLDTSTVALYTPPDSLVPDSTMRALVQALAATVPTTTPDSILSDSVKNIFRSVDWGEGLTLQRRVDSLQSAVGDSAYAAALRRLRTSTAGRVLRRQARVRTAAIDSLVALTFLAADPTPRAPLPERLASLDSVRVDTLRSGRFNAVVQALTQDTVRTIEVVSQPDTVAADTAAVDSMMTAQGPPGARPMPSDSLAPAADSVQTDSLRVGPPADTVQTSTVRMVPDTVRTITIVRDTVFIDSVRVVSDVDQAAAVRALLQRRRLPTDTLGQRIAPARLDLQLTLTQRPLMALVPDSSVAITTQPLVRPRSVIEQDLLRPINRYPQRYLEAWKQQQAWRLMPRYCKLYPQTLKTDPQTTTIR